MKRVLVTRSARQGSELAEALRAQGAEPLLLPAIEILEPESYEKLDAVLPVLDTYDWLLFTSANAVETFARRSGTQEKPANLRIAAIGPATALAAVQAGFVVDLVPSQAVAEAFVKALVPHVHGNRGRPTRFLLVRAEEAREYLPDELRRAGGEVTVVPGYRTVMPRESIALLRSVFSTPEQWPSAITFTSSSTVRNLLALCEAAKVTLPHSALRISIGPITSEALRAAGLPAHAEAKEATVAALAEAVLRSLNSVHSPSGKES